MDESKIPMMGDPMNYGVFMRATELNLRSGRRLSLLKQMENILASDKEKAPTEVEAQAMLRLGKSEYNYQTEIAQGIWRRKRDDFYDLPWFKRLWRAFRRDL